MKTKKTLKLKLKLHTITTIEKLASGYLCVDTVVATTEQEAYAKANLDTYLRCRGKEVRYREIEIEVPEALLQVAIQEDGA